MLESPLKRVYWEMSAGCNLRCIHCRRTDVMYRPDPEELSTQEGFSLIDSLQEMGSPALIFSGGEPLMRRDFFEIASYARDKKIPCGIATNGTLVNESRAQRLRQGGIHYASISFDGAEPATHDFFRGAGNFERSKEGFQLLKNAGIKVQINFTVTRRNIGEIEKVYEMAQEMGACALYLFLLVPVGCGAQIPEKDRLNALEVENWLLWVVEKEKNSSLPLKIICAPQYQRVAWGNPAPADERKGCLAGIHMCFISHKGDVFPCGYLPSSCGNIRQRPLKEIWKSAKLFQDFRNPELLSGNCGNCAFKIACGGCRARSFYAYGNALAGEPYCLQS